MSKSRGIRFSNHYSPSGKPYLHSRLRGNL